METQEEFKTVTKIIEELLEEDERCRNDDKWLTYRVMRYYTKIYIPFADFEKMTAFETIKRCRAKIQNNEGRFLPTSEKVKEKRRQREVQIKKFVKEEGVTYEMPTLQKKHKNS